MEMIMVNRTDLQAMFIEWSNNNIDQTHKTTHQCPVSSQEYLTSKEAGIFLGKTPQAIWSLVHRKQIKFYKPHGRLYFLKSDLIEWIEEGRYKTDDELIKGFENDLVIRGRIN